MDIDVLKEPNFMRGLAEVEVENVEVGGGVLVGDVNEPEAGAAGDVGNEREGSEDAEDGGGDIVAQGGFPQVVLEIEAGGGGVAAVAVEDVAVAVGESPVVGKGGFCFHGGGRVDGVDQGGVEALEFIETRFFGPDVGIKSWNKEDYLRTFAWAAVVISSMLAVLVAIMMQLSRTGLRIGQD